MKSLNLKISARDSRHTDTRVHLKALFDQWLPLSGSLLAMVVDKLPSPQEMISERVEKLMCSGVKTFDSLPEETQSFKNGMFHSIDVHIVKHFKHVTSFFREKVSPLSVLIPCL